MARQPFVKTINCYNNLVCTCLVFTGHGLKCYQCINTKGWDDCETNKKELNCSNALGSQYDRCGKVFIHGKDASSSVAFYIKGCALSSVCSQNTCKSFVQDPSTNIEKCEVDCCQGDLCNGAKVPMVSAIVLLACALVAFLR